MFTEEIESYILSHIDEEGDLLKALNRDANVNLLRPRMLSGHLQGRLLKLFLSDDAPPAGVGDRYLYRLCHPLYGGGFGRGGLGAYDRGQ